MADSSDDTERYVRLPRLDSPCSSTRSVVPCESSTRRDCTDKEPPNQTNSFPGIDRDSGEKRPMDRIISNQCSTNSRSFTQTKGHGQGVHSENIDDVLEVKSSNLIGGKTSTDVAGWAVIKASTVNNGKTCNNEISDAYDEALDKPRHNDPLGNTDGQTNLRFSTHFNGKHVGKPCDNTFGYTKPDLVSKTTTLSRDVSRNNTDNDVYKNWAGAGSGLDSGAMEGVTSGLEPVDSGKHQDSGSMEGIPSGSEPVDSGKHQDSGEFQRAPVPPAPNAVPPDGGWGWVVCFTCLWVNGIVMGTVNTFGILYNHMREMYAQGDEEVSLKTSFVGSCMNGVMFLMSCVSGILCDVIGLRHTAVIGGSLCVIGFLSSAFVSQLELLYLTYGVILGTGFGLVFSPMVAISGHYFKTHIGLVNGIVTFGASAFTVAMSFALPILLRHFGLRETLMGFAGLGVTLTLCTLTWKPLVSREYGNVNSDETGSACKNCLSFVSRKVLNGRVWRNRRFLCWSLAMSVSRFGYLEPYFHMVNHVTHILPGSNASILITIMAAVSGVSKLVVGLLSDLMKKYRIYFQQVALLVYGVIVLCIPFSVTFPGFIVIAVFLGLADAVIMALFGPNAIELVGPGNASQAVGFASLLAIPTFLSAPAITGSMHDHLDSYNVGFHVTGAITLISSVLMCLVANPFEAKKEEAASKSSSKINKYSDSTRRRSSHAYVNSAFQKGTNSESQFSGTQRYDNQLYDSSDVRRSDVWNKDGTTNHSACNISDGGQADHVTECSYRNVADVHNDSVNTGRKCDMRQCETTEYTDVRL